MLFERGLDLARVEADPADLELLVGTAEVDECLVVEEPDEVAGPVPAPIPVEGERAHVAVEVAGREPTVRDVEFADRSGWDVVAVRVEHSEVDARCRLPIGTSGQRGNASGSHSWIMQPTTASVGPYSLKIRAAGSAARTRRASDAVKASPPTTNVERACSAGRRRTRSSRCDGVALHQLRSVAERSAASPRGRCRGRSPSAHR
jgi:hypothetical protein